MATEVITTRNEPVIKGRAPKRGSLNEEGNHSLPKRKSNRDISKKAGIASLNRNKKMIKRIIIDTIAEKNNAPSMVRSLLLDMCSFLGFDF
jgi:hypothetical protein